MQRIDETDTPECDWNSGVDERPRLTTISGKEDDAIIRECAADGDPVIPVDDRDTPEVLRKLGNLDCIPVQTLIGRDVQNPSLRTDDYDTISGIDRPEVFEDTCVREGPRYPGIVAAKDKAVRRDSDEDPVGDSLDIQDVITGRLRVDPCEAGVDLRCGLAERKDNEETEEE